MSLDAPESPDPSDEAERIELQAALWLARRDRGFSEAERSEFQAWRTADPRRAAIAARLTAGWRALDALRALDPGAAREGTGAHAAFPGAPDPDLLLLSGRRRRRWGVVVAALGAAAAIAVAGALFSPAPRPSGPSAARPAAARPEPAPEIVMDGRRETLPDGSVANLNRGASIVVQFTTSERLVRLVRGEATFSVVHNPARPFCVSAQGVVVRDVGTVFNVRLESGEVDVLVTKGEVQVAREVSRRAGAPAPGLSPLVAAGQRAIVPTALRAAPLRIENVSHDELERLLAWQDPRIIFSGQTLAEAAAQFNRYNRRQLVIADAPTARIRIGGCFRANQVNAFVRLLGASFGVSAENRGDDVVLRKSR